MKKLMMIATVLVAFVGTGNAQMKVFSDGHISVGNIPSSSHPALLTVGTSTTWDSNYIPGIRGSLSTYSSNYNIGVWGSIKPTSSQSTGRAFGVYGSAGNMTSGYNYGVYGIVSGSNNGAGVFGTTTANSGVSISGRYAGYFHGALYVTGNVTAANYLTASDIRLKENITAIDDEEGESALDKLLGMQVIKYNYKEKEIPATEKDTITNTAKREDEEMTKQLHFGLSAQELKTIYPNLVIEGQDGYLTINYVELVPVLIRSIQELKAELDVAKENGNAKKAAPKTTSVDTTMTANRSVLYQNSPNPFKERTEIRFSLCNEAKDASICIFDMQGKMLKRIPVNTGESSIIIDGYELGAGMYLYSLIVNNQEIDTMRMILSK